MARGGIDKALVKQARQTLLAKGRNPSIDAVRIELGDTGSKTTIHRYLKELDNEDSTQLGNEAMLSETIKNTIANLATQLHSEASHIVRESEQKYETKYQTWQLTQDEHSQTVNEATQKIESLTAALEVANQQTANITEKYQAEAIQSREFAQHSKDLTVLLNDKDRQIKSLEEKHQHSRESLAHFRESAKEQREQDIRRHDQQVQQLQTEQRKLQQTISLKQDEITQLNKDNARLISEMSESRKQKSEAVEQNRQQQNELNRMHETLTIKLTTLENLQSQLDDNKQQLDEMRAAKNQTDQEKHALMIDITRLKTELQVKNDLYAQLNHRKSE